MSGSQIFIKLTVARVGISLPSFFKLFQINPSQKNIFSPFQIQINSNFHLYHSHIRHTIFVFNWRLASSSTHFLDTRRHLWSIAEQNISRFDGFFRLLLWRVATTTNWRVCSCFSYFLQRQLYRKLSAAFFKFHGRWRRFNCSLYLVNSFWTTIVVD
jgi:hypothetical protein